MLSFLICLIILIIGYFTYGKIVEKIFVPDIRETPAIKCNDGVDYVSLPLWKLFLIQLLNIAGLGPIFGAVSGAIWGPVVLLWITFGTIFAGGVHDYFSGMISVRNDGKSISEISGVYLGPIIQNIMRLFCVVLLLMVGVVFAVGPANLIATLIKDNGGPEFLINIPFWLAIIFIYYFIATFISVDKVIGKIYPLFGICLIIMTIGVAYGIISKEKFVMPELWDNFRNMHPEKIPIWSGMFVTVACGAISGFHATQSPIMARCLSNEKYGRCAFYGAMVAEGIIALVWAMAGCSVYPAVNGFMETLNDANGGNATTVYYICKNTMGGIGITLAMLGVIACPITSGDTAFRSARLTIADWFNINQKSFKNRFLICIFLLGIGMILGFGNAFGIIDYDVIWRYFSWTNQTLAMIVLWTASMFLAINKKNFWITVIPATFMTAVSITYFISADECLNFDTKIAYPLGILVAILFFMIFIITIKKRKKNRTI